MKIVSFIQGSKKWHKHREEYDNASEAAAMLDLDKEVMRDDLIRMYATGEKKEVSQYVKDVIFKEGHEKEALARVILERELGEELYPVVGIKGNLSASFDGLTMLETICFEHKQWNEKLAALVAQGILPDAQMPQVQQQLLVSKAEKNIFVVSDGTVEKREKMEVFPDTAWFKRIEAGWIQFHKDVDNYKHVEIMVEPITESIEALPSLNVQITGGVTASNLESYEKTALAFIDNINTDLKTDSDFANADMMVKFCSKTEKELDAVKKSALDQTADIADLFKTIDRLKFEIRDKRLTLSKLVKARKDAIRGEIVGEAKYDIRRYIDDKNSNLPTGISVAFYDVDFNSVIKNKRTVQSLRNAVSTELARCKIEVSEQVDLIRGNYDALQDVAGEYGFLFNDLHQIITKDRDDLLNLAKQRIADHKAKEARKMEVERQRIRLEEEAKAKEKVEAERKAEEARKMEEERTHMVKQDAERELREHTAAVEHDSEQMATAPNWYTCDECGNKVNDGDVCQCSQLDKQKAVDSIKVSAESMIAACNTNKHFTEGETEQLILSCNSDDIQDLLTHLSTKYMMIAQADGCFSVERY